MEEAADDRILCKFCGRKFNETAAQRHITFCEQKTKKDSMKTGGSKPQATIGAKGRTTGNNFGYKR